MTLAELALDAPGPRLLLALESLANADNVGAIFRNAAAFGVHAVVLDARSCDPLYRKATRTSMGATLTVPWARLEPWPDALARVRDAGVVLAALTPHAAAQPLEAFVAAHARRAVALLVGAEGDGLGEAALAAADVHVRIVMAPGADSINVATATGIALHALAAP